MSILYKIGVHYRVYFFDFLLDKRRRSGSHHSGEENPLSVLQCASTCRAVLTPNIVNRKK
jgi:hypothetical protein